MVTWIFTVGFILSQASADTSIHGRAMDHVRVNRDSGRMDASFARVAQFEIRQSRYRDLLAYELRAESLSWVLSNADRADFSRASLKNSVWQGGEIKGARFREADLRNASFSGVNIQSCSMEGADLRGTRFDNTVLFDCTFARALFNDSTLLPFDAATAVSLGMIYAP